MGDLFYKAVRAVGSHAFWVSSSPVVLGRENIPREGRCILACNHTSPYDIAILIRHVPRLVDFVSVTEVFRNPVMGWFYGALNAFPLDRSRPDARTVRTILKRLEHGRLVGMFPEAGLRRGEASVVHSGRIRAGIGKIAVLSGAAVVPAIIVNSGAYARPGAWLPHRRTRYGVMFGGAIPADLEPPEIEGRLVEAMVRMYGELAARLPEGCREV
jgi:1-acyl-sn-glycerol-3-phosphate acyltransferase